jgi:hypothetical protein
MTTMRMFRLALPVAAFVLTATLAVGPVKAQQVDAKGESELTSRGQQIDKTAAAHDSARVTARIVDDWKGKTFRFDTAGAPRALTAQDVRDLRAKRLGYGEISILLALAANQPNPTSAKSVNEILAMRKSGEGWGKLARDLGYKNLGSVNKSVKATERGMAKMAAEKKPDKPTATAKAEKMDRPDKPEKPEKPEKAEKPGR